MKQRITGLVALAALAVIVVGCSVASAQDATGSTTSSAEPGAIHIDAKNIAFVESSVTAPADRSFQIAFASQDSAPHNVAIADANGTTVFTGDVVSGPGATTYTVPALKAGTYHFRCDVHPGMTGTLIVQ